MTDTVNTHFERALGIHQRLNEPDMIPGTEAQARAAQRFTRETTLATAEQMFRAADAIEQLVEALRPVAFYLHTAPMTPEQKAELGVNDDADGVVIPIHPTTRKGDS